MRGAVQIPERFYSLDVIRGFAALSIVFWHWQQFFFKGVVPNEYIATQQPFYPVFFLFYNVGSLAVDFFFSLSGFIFFWLYFDRIKKREIDAWTFAVLRLSRLYPLHLMTLCAVLLGQVFASSQTSQFVVYPFNDLYHFLLNIFFASGWGFEVGWSFNAPVWSVSIEILLYGIFFVYCLLFNVSYRMLLLIILFSMALILFHPLLGRGMFSFFIGAVVFEMYKSMVKTNRAYRVRAPLVAITVLGWLLTVLESKYHVLWPMVQNGIREVAVYNNHDYSGEVVHALYYLCAATFLFPLTILTSAIVETCRGHFGKRISFIGDISYSVYLIHFPLQLAFIIATVQLGIAGEFFYSSASMLLYFSLLVILGFVSHHKFERPVQKAIRNGLIRKLVG